MGIKAIITAGGPVPRSLAETVNVSRKALIEVGVQSLLQTAVQAARDCRFIDGLVVVGNQDVQAALDDSTDFLPEGENLVANIERGFEHFGGESQNYLTISPDLPFLTGGCLDEFLERSTGDCRIGVPLVTRTDFLDCYPGAPNRFARLAGGREVTTGSCFYLDGPALKSNFPLFHDLFRFRKYPHRLAVMLGFRILWAFAFGGLSVEMAEERATQLTGAEVKAVEVANAAIAYDIDNLENYNFALQVQDR